MLDHVVNAAQFVSVRNRFGDPKYGGGHRETNRPAHFQACNRKRGSHRRDDVAVLSFGWLELAPPDACSLAMKRHSITKLSFRRWTPSIEAKKMGHRAHCGVYVRRTDPAERIQPSRVEMKVHDRSAAQINHHL